MIDLKKIIDLSQLPQSIALCRSYELVIATSIIDEVYEPIPKYLLDRLLSMFQGSSIALSDISIESGEIEVFERRELKFNASCISAYIDETGLQSFLLEFLEHNVYLLGLDLDFVFILSPKDGGFISKTGGIKYYMKKAAEQFNNRASGLSEDIFALLFNAVQLAQKINVDTLRE